MTFECPACRRREAQLAVATPRDREYFVSRPARYLRCLSCSSLVQDPFPGLEEAAGFYGADYQNYVSTRVPGLATLAKHYDSWIARRFLRDHSPDKAILDFGCGKGAFLASLKAAGCSALSGYDPVIYEEARRIGGIDLYDSLDALAESGRSFDVIRMNHVIEHLVAPQDILSRLARMLRDGGMIIGQTPNPEHYTARLMGGYWGPLHFPYHTVLLSRRGLAGLAAASGLRLVSTRAASIPTGWSMSFENLLKAAIGSRRRGRSMVYSLIAMASMPLALLDQRLSPGASANYDFILQPA